MNDPNISSKLVRIPKDMIRAIKRRAIDESERYGERITENDIVEMAIAQYLSGRIEVLETLEKKLVSIRKFIEQVAA